MKKHLILRLVVSFAKSRSFVFLKFLLDTVQLPKLKLHYWENIKITVFGLFSVRRIFQLTVPRRTYTDRTIPRLLKSQMFKIALEWLCFYFVLNETSNFCNYNYPIHSCDKDSNLRVSSAAVPSKDNLLFVILDNH